MIKILVKVAAEISVGKDTIVEFLSKKGYEIENKPNAKITDNMYDELVREFKSSIDIKEKADQMIIGTRPVPKKEPLPPLPGLSNINLVKPAVSLTQTPVSTPQPEKVQEPIKTEEVEEVIKAEAPKAQLKILGKIDLSPKKKEEPKKVEPRPEPIVKVEEQPPVEVIKTEPPKNEVELPKVEKTELEPPKVEVKVQVAENKSDSVNESPETSEKAEDAVIKAEAPQLKGLKILGKINTDKFNKKPVTKPNPPQHQKSDKPSDASSADERSKRKRKRKKVTTDNSAKQQGGGGQQQGSGGNTGGQKHSGENRPNVGARPHDGNRNSDSRRHHQNQQHNRNRPPIAKKEEVKEITKKEIDDQIKATMARLSVGGKSKRQKIRRDKRDVMREKQEQQMHNEGMEKLQITEFISVSELASVLDVSVTEVITTCISLGYMVSINQRLDAEVIEIIANEFGQEVEFISAEEQLSSDEEVDEIDDPKDLKPRAPIVTVMGHVDHGKTSLLDFIRSANVVSGEAGGITQHIGAYEVVHNGKKITFLDTPGHEAFTAMRARGAKITDVAVIIIAADDNVMPQTKEAISHAQAAGVPIVFAINKIDKEGADANRIKQELASMNMLVEEWGGKYQSQDISAKKGLNVDLLLEKILLEAEILDLEANPKRKANGTVIEASLDKGRGYVTKILVQNGTLNIGDPIVAGEYSGKIKAMFNERGTKVNSAGPSSPVLILGLSGAPQAGEKFKEMTSEADARQLASKRAQITREQTTRASKRISLDEIGRRLALGNFKELKIIVKGDVDGSIEALADSLIKLSVAAVQVSVIHKAVGQIVESDVLLASASDAIIIGFQVRPSMNARKLAEKEGVEIKTYSIIYEAINEVKSAMEGMLEPTREEKIIGQIEVRELFKVSKVGTVAGCYVLEGKFTRNTPIRVIRDGIVTYPSKEGMTASLSSLKRFKDDVKEVKSGMECGLTIHNFNDLKLGDIIEGYEITEVKQTL